MERARLIENEATFTSDTDFIDLEANNVKGVFIGQHFLAVTDAPTLTEVLASIAGIKVYEGAELFSEILFKDLAALNMLYLGHQIGIELTDGTDNDQGYVGSVVLPLRKTSKKDMKIWLEHGAQSAALDNNKIILGVHSVESPLGRGIALGYVSSSATANFKAHDLSRSGWNVIALLLFGTTVIESGATDTSRTLAELKVKVNKVLVGHYNWSELDESIGVRLSQDTPDDWWDYLEHYKMIIFDEPLPADEFKVEVKGDSATDAFRIVAVYA